MFADAYLWSLDRSL
jgi:hypothetical protein